MDRTVLDQALAAFTDPVLGDHLPAVITEARLGDRGWQLQIDLNFAAEHYADDLQQRLQRYLSERMAPQAVTLDVRWQVQAQPVQGSLQPLPGIANIIAVASGKGGVGKSTVAANLALALAAEGASVGMLDADIYGPSQPRMLGVEGARPEVLDDKKMQPVMAHGIALMSIGLLVDAEQPTIWRGPMVTQALQQMLAETRWPALDYLIIDLPPGTGDTQLSLAQRIPVSGAVIVTTPQDIALLDARKGLAMFHKVGVSILGIVENMALHICSNCGHQDPVFGSDGGRRMAEQYAVPLLGSLPLNGQIREQADAGLPTVVADPAGDLAASYRQMALRTACVLSQMGVAEFPDIIIED